MTFWIGILVGVLFAYFAVKIGFYETLIMMFNVVISVFLGIFLGPTIANIPVVADTPFCNILSILTITAVAFLILHGISFVFLTGQFNIPFPKVLDVIGAGFLGFLGGFLIWSFITVLVCVSPISQNAFVKGAGFGGHFQQMSISYVSWWGDLVHKAAYSQDNKQTTQQVISGLLKNAEKKTQKKETRQIEPNKPADLTGPKRVETNVKKKIPGPNSDDTP